VLFFNIFIHQEKQQKQKRTRNNKNLTNLTNLISFHELCYLRTHQNASVKCHETQRNQVRLRLDLLWTAPELLYKRHAGLNTKKTIQGTQSGDIYSFAIILQEILYRALPYQATGEQTMVTKG